MEPVSNPASPADAAPRILGVIPARLASTRLPRKVLREIAGRPMLAWVYEAARACPQLHDVLIATDSEEVATLCSVHGWNFRLTSPSLPSGTDRVHAIAQEVPADIYVNVQGDEPLVLAEHLTALLMPFASETASNVQVTTIKTPCTPENIQNPNAVKVVTAADGRALYFSRATIPYDRDGAQGRAQQPGRQTAIAYWKHIGLYAYRKAALDRFPHLPASDLESTERLEQLRFLQNGIDIYVEPTPHDTIGVDTEEDLKRVEALLLGRIPSRT